MHISWIIFLYIFPGKIEYCWSVSWYLKGFVALGWWSLLTSVIAAGVTGETHVVLGISMVPSPLPNSNFLKQLRIYSSIFACAPRTWHCTFGFFRIPSIPPVCKVMYPMLSSSWCKDSLTMIASFMAQIIFTGGFWATWGTICHQDAFATIFMCREHTCQSTSGTNTRRALRRRLSRLGSCCHSQITSPQRSITCVRKAHERYYFTPPKPNNEKVARLHARKFPPATHHYSLKWRRGVPRSGILAAQLGAARNADPWWSWWSMVYGSRVSRGSPEKSMKIISYPIFNSKVSGSKRSLDKTWRGLPRLQNWGCCRKSQHD